MELHKNCPACDHRIPANPVSDLNRTEVFSCYSCGAYYRWEPTVLAGVALGLGLVKLLVAFALAAAGLWAVLALFVAVSIPVVGGLAYLGLQPRPVDFGKPTGGDMPKQQTHTTLH